MLTISWGLRSLPPVWVWCLVNRNMLLISWVVLVCHCASLLIQWLLPPRVAYRLVSHSRTPLVFKKLLVLFSISHLLDPIYAMLSIRSVSLCMLLLRVIGLLSNVYYATWKVRLPSIFTLLVPPRYRFMVLLRFFFPVLLPPFGATMWVLRICLLILSFMHVQSMLRLIITLFEIYRVAEKKIHIRFKSSEN
jgi:hypothetical protein